MTLLPIRYKKEENRFYADVRETHLNPAKSIIDPPTSDESLTDDHGDDGVG